MTDLAQAIDLPLTLDYIAVSSYGKATKSSGEVKLVKDLDQGLEGRDLLVVEDIVDTGLTLNYLVNLLKARGPALAEGGDASLEAGAAAGERPRRLRGLHDRGRVRGGLRPRLQRALPEPQGHRGLRRLDAPSLVRGRGPAGRGPARRRSRARAPGAGHAEAAHRRWRSSPRRPRSRADGSASASDTRAPRGGHDAARAVHELGRGRLQVHHQVLVDLAEAHHGGGGDRVQHRLGGRAGLEAGRAREHLGAAGTAITTSASRARPGRGRRSRARCARRARARRASAPRTKGVTELAEMPTRTSPRPQPPALAPADVVAVLGSLARAEHRRVAAGHHAADPARVRCRRWAGTRRPPARRAGRWCPRRGRPRRRRLRGTSAASRAARAIAPRARAPRRRAPGGPRRAGGATTRVGGQRSRRAAARVAALGEQPGPAARARLALTGCLPSKGKGSSSRQAQRLASGPAGSPCAPGCRRRTPRGSAGTGRRAR